jgi:hypothetical protein
LVLFLLPPLRGQKILTCWLGTIDVFLEQLFPLKYSDCFVLDDFVVFAEVALVHSVEDPDPLSEDNFVLMYVTLVLSPLLALL